jgi:SAM-dependent methyltransferase
MSGGGSESVGEELLAQARYQFAMALEHCTDCRDYHALYGYLRLAKPNDYFEAGRGALQRLVREHSPSGGHALIAGAADSRLFALLAQTVAGFPSVITVADRCRTPLLVCRRYAERHGLAVATIEADIAKELPGGPYDIALAHLTLMFVPVAAQAAFLRNLSQSLVDGGRLILAHWLRPDKPPADPTMEARHYAERVLAALAAKGVSLPEEEARFRCRIEGEYAVRRARDDNRIAFETVEVHLKAAAFSIRERIDARPARTTLATDPTKAAAIEARTFIASRDERGSIVIGDASGAG